MSRRHGREAFSTLEDAVHQCRHRRHRAEGGLQSQHAAKRLEPILDRVVHRDIGPPESVDTLLRVPHHEQGPRSRLEHQPALRSPIGLPPSLCTPLSPPPGSVAPSSSGSAASSMRISACIGSVSWNSSTRTRRYRRPSWRRASTLDRKSFTVSIRRSWKLSRPVRRLSASHACAAPTTIRMATAYRCMRHCNRSA